MRFWGFLLAAMVVAFGARAAEPASLLNVSYDPTREFYDDYNAWFAADWKRKTGQDIRLRQSHGGSGKQARSVMDGLNADVVTLALAYDIDVLAKRGGLLSGGWQEKLPHRSAPMSSTVVFLVRKGNPKQIRNWNDLVRDGVEVITPNPKTSGGARWNYLAAWGYALEANRGDEAKAQQFMKRLFAHVPMMDTGARGATTTFVQRGIGDVLIAWESEAYLAMQELGKEAFTLVRPSVSVLAETPVAVVEKNAQKNGTEKLARAYLEGLYSEQGQELIARHYYRPADEAVAERYKERFPPMYLLTIEDFGGWEAVQKKHFDDGGIFDRLYNQ